MISLTPCQSELLRFVAGFQQAHGYSPSFREMQKGTGWASLSRLYELLEALEERGAIRRLRGRARAIEILVPVWVPQAPDGAPLHAVRLPEFAAEIRA